MHTVLYSTVQYSTVHTVQHSEMYTMNYTTVQTVQSHIQLELYTCSTALMCTQKEKTPCNKFKQNNLQLWAAAFLLQLCLAPLAQFIFLFFLLY